MSRKPPTLYGKDRNREIYPIDEEYTDETIVKSKNRQQGMDKETERTSKYEIENRKDDRNEAIIKKTSHQKNVLYTSDRTVSDLDHAATKIQAAFRGYQAKKNFWKKLEHHRRQRLADSRQNKQNEYSIASVTSIVDDSSLSGLALNADLNLGLTNRLPYIDSSQRHNAMRDLKTKSFSDDISSVSQLQSETSPTIIVLGGTNPLQSKDHALGAYLFVYNVQKDKWYFGGTMPEPRNYHTAAYLNGKIYVIGGYNPLQMTATQSTFQMSVRSKRWRKRADMHHPRACHGMCIANDNIIVMGGRDSAGKLLSTVEMYHPKRDQWVLLKSMPEAIMGLSCAVLDDCIFVIGGIINEGHSAQNSVSNHAYAFDFEKEVWYKAPSLPEPRAFASAATLIREIWLWCGVKDALNEDGFLMSTNSVLVYNPDVSKWEQRTSIGTPKHAAAIVKFGRRLHILGGISFGSKEVLNENDYYNREIERYMEGACLPCPLAGLSAVVLPIDHIATSNPKWNVENINEDIMNEAATRIQAAYRGYTTRKIISNYKFPVSRRFSASNNNFRGDAFVMHHTSIFDPYSDKWKASQRVQIEDWPPVPNFQASNFDINLKDGVPPRGYTVSTNNNQNIVKRYRLMPPHVDPNLSMMGHLCNVYKRAKKILGLRKVEHLPKFAVDLTPAHKLQDDSLPMILVIGGLQPKDPVNLSYGKMMLRYHILKNRFEYFGALPEPRNYHAAVYFGRCIYVSGGCDADKRNSGEMVATKTMYCFDTHTNEWEEKAEMICPRAYHNLVVARKKIFAIGGRDDNGRLNASIEAYDPVTDEWCTLSAMPTPRMGMACAVMGDEIWCMGGIGVSRGNESVSYPVLSSVISYDIGKDEWSDPRPPLRCPRAFGSCVVINGSMWLVGGASKDTSNDVLISMASVDKYYLHEAQWVRKTLMNFPRHSAAVLAVESCIYILGGVSSQEWSPLSRNEMIGVDDISLHTCEPLPVPLTGLAAVVVPPTIQSAIRPESLAMLLHTNLTYH